MIRGLRFTKLKGSEYSGHHGHAGRPGQVGGSVGAGGSFGGDVSFATQTSFGQAHPDGSITFNKDQYSKLDQRGRESGIAHEIIHNTIEDFVLKNMSEWDKAESFLLIREGRGGRKLFFGGNTRLGESVSDALSTYLVKGKKPGTVSTSKWKAIQYWSPRVIKRAGYSPIKLQKDVGEIRMALDKQLLASP